MLVSRILQGEKFGFIKKIKFNHNYAFFENRSFHDHELDFFLLQNPKIQAIIDFLHLKDSSLTTITQDLAMHYSTVRKYLQILTERALIIPDLTLKQIKYHINTLLEKKLHRIEGGTVILQDYIP